MGRETSYLKMDLTWGSSDAPVSPLTKNTADPQDTQPPADPRDTQPPACGARPPKLKPASGFVPVRTEVASTKS